MKVKLGKNQIEFNGKRNSLLISLLAQKSRSHDSLHNKVNKQLNEFVKLVPEMGPEKLVIVRWHSGYEMGFPNDYYGIGAISCKSIQPWKSKLVDHLIDHKNPFSKITGAKLLNQFDLDYKNKIVSLKEGSDRFSNYYLFPEELQRKFERMGYSFEIGPLNNGKEIYPEDFNDFDFELGLRDEDCEERVREENEKYLKKNPGR